MAHRYRALLGPDDAQYHLCVCCDAPYDADDGVSGSGVSFVLVKCDDHSDVTPLLYAWHKRHARSSAEAERLAIMLALENSNDNVELYERIRARNVRLLHSAEILSDCETVVEEVRAEWNREIFVAGRSGIRKCFHCDLEVKWESNHRHALNHPIAVVDRMAREAILYLENGSSFVAQTPDGLTGERIE